VTGHTGFKGSWLTRWLLDLGADVTGYALEPDTTPALFDALNLKADIDSRIGDIRDGETLAALVSEVRPEIVLHLAAQPLVRRSYTEPAYTFDVNVMGTVNLLQAVKACDETRVLVNVTTDKVYENPESGHPFTEREPLGGHDPYSASKACSEIVTAAYRSSFFGDGPAVATARAGNVIGGGDWASDRIVPDCARALIAGQPVVVRNPGSVRPWQHVLEPLSGYLALAESLWIDGASHAQAYNFGPPSGETHTVRDVVERSIEAWGAGRWTTPEALVQPHEAGLLALDVSKAQADLGWRPVWDFDETVDRTMRWYQRHAEDAASAQMACDEDIAAYAIAAAASSAGRDW
jgi:CDP-glucose 4,6-dehydratase